MSVPPQGPGQWICVAYPCQSQHGKDMQRMSMPDPVAYVKKLILKDLRQSYMHVGRITALAVRSMNEKTEFKPSSDHMQLIDNFMAICDEIEINLSTIMESQKQANKLERVFDIGEKPTDPSMFGMINHYVDQSKAVQSIFDRSTSRLISMRQRMKAMEQRPADMNFDESHPRHEERPNAN